MAAVSRKPAVHRGARAELSVHIREQELVGKPAVAVLSHWGQEGLVLITQANPMAVGFLNLPSELLWIWMPHPLSLNSPS